MTIPERISDFLSRRYDRRYCDTCIQERLGLKWRQQVQLITATLAVTTGFRREFDKCCTCQEIKQVTHALSGGPRSRFDWLSDSRRTPVPDHSGRAKSEISVELSDDRNRPRER